jgi:glycosyltransferase involved in cell wall biosynthesis
MDRGSDILAFTPTYGDRPFISTLVPAARRTAGIWFDWLVVAGRPSSQLRTEAEILLNKPDRTGIQYFKTWPDNRGQHHATKVALDLARTQGYKWLLRLDDDVSFKTDRWLKKLINRDGELREKAPHKLPYLVMVPFVTGLQNQIEPIGFLEYGQSFRAELLPICGGVCRLMPVKALEGYDPPMFAPKGRGDPQSLAVHLKIGEGFVDSSKAFFVRFPDIRVVHRTSQLEGMDTPEQAHERRMAKYWPYLGVE